MKLFDDEPNLSLQDLAVILCSIRVNVERVEKEKKKSRSTIDKRIWQSTIDEYTKSYDKIKVLEKSMEKRILRDSYNTEIKVSSLW